MNCTSATDDSFCRSSILPSTTKRALLAWRTESPIAMPTPSSRSPLPCQQVTETVNQICISSRHSCQVCHLPLLHRRATSASLQVLYFIPDLRAFFLDATPDASREFSLLDELALLFRMLASESGHACQVRTMLSAVPVLWGPEEG